MAADPHAYREVDWTIVKPHARQRWRRRAPSHLEDANLHAIWRDSTPVDYPGAENNAYARYHPESGLVLVADYGFLTTCITLEDRPESTRDYVESQL